MSEPPNDRVPDQTNGGARRSRPASQTLRIAASLVVAANFIVALVLIGRHQSPLSGVWLLMLPLVVVFSRDFQLRGRKWERTILALIIVSGLGYLASAVIKGW